jgi:hypothetical protein
MIFIAVIPLYRFAVLKTIFITLQNTTAKSFNGSSASANINMYAFKRFRTEAAYNQEMILAPLYIDSGVYARLKPQL